MIGRPPLYSDEDIKNLTALYIDSCEDSIEARMTGQSDSFTKYDNVVKVKLPTIEGLALYLKVHKDTIYTWRKEKPFFSDLIETLLQKQAQALINNGLAGTYNPTIAKVLLTKHGYTDKQEIEQKTEHSGEIKHTIDYSKLSDAALQEIEKLGPKS